GETNRKERKYLHPGITHHVYKRFADVPAADIVIDDPDLYPFPCLAHHQLTEFHPDGVRFKTVELKVYKAGGRCHGVKHGGIRLDAVYEQVNLVVKGKQ